MSWDAGDPVTVDDTASLANAIANRWELYEGHLGQDVDLTYFYMSQADARMCVQTGSLTGTTKVRSTTHPAEAPGWCMDNGYTWFVAIRSDAPDESNIDVVSWGRAIREEDDEDDEDNNEDDEDDEDNNEDNNDDNNEDNSEDNSEDDNDNDDDDE
ncbi:hypothetical protein AYJ54_17715 [Bradyrhizobium centrolobii]|uniref:Uncharacterized protein n=2 Tax=Bradyrhizobium centrolobii TaxID=1505087 RepID=A0A176YLE3_9BRAD|nr:hypothetical protein AYJ54_17715 [Bradyrhizobium centrolobii]